MQLIGKTEAETLIIEMSMLEWQIIQPLLKKHLEGKNLWRPSGAVAEAVRRLEDEGQLSTLVAHVILRESAAFISWQNRIGMFYQMPMGKFLEIVHSRRILDVLLIGPKRAQELRRAFPLIE